MAKLTAIEKIREALREKLSPEEYAHYVHHRDRRCEHSRMDREKSDDELAFGDYNWYAEEKARRRRGQ